jgi:hypothetical protein
MLHPLIQVRKLFSIYLWIILSGGAIVQTCERMRTAVILSALLLLLGIVLEKLVEASLLAGTMGQLALLLMLAGAVLLALTFLVSVLPGSGKSLRECLH